MPSSPSQPRHKRYSARWQARLDPETHAKLQELGQTFHRKQAPILRHVMQWALAHTNGWVVDRSIPAAPHPVTVLVNPALLQRVQAAAATQGVSVAAWVRQAMRQVTREDFPASWRAGDAVPRDHDSGRYQRRFMLRLDEETSHKLETLIRAFERPAAEVIRQLIGQAKPEDFPRSWQIALNEHQHTYQPKGVVTPRH
jgi:predicted HicB family RNase H-like nuclease